MTTATLNKPKVSWKTIDGVKEPVGFEAIVDLGAVSINAKKVSVGFSCQLDHEVARKVLALGMLSVKLDTVDKELFDASVEATAECGRLSIGWENDQSGRLSFNRDAVKIPALVQFAKNKAKLWVKRQGPAGEQADDGDGEE